MLAELDSCVEKRAEVGPIKPESIFTMITGMTVTVQHRGNNNKSKEIPLGALWLRLPSSKFYKRSKNSCFVVLFTGCPKSRQSNQ